MRIAMMADYYKPVISGVTTYISMTKRFLEKAGHEVYVFTFGGWDYKDDEENVIRSPGMPTLFGKGYYFAAAYSPSARQLLKTMDIVNVNHPLLSGRLALRYCQPVDIPIVFTNHTRYDSYGYTYTFGIARRLYMRTLKNFLTDLYRQVDLVIVPSEGAKHELRPFGLPENVRVVPHGVDLSEYRANVTPLPRSNFGFAEDDVIFVYVGRLGFEKNLPLLMQAFGKIASPNPSIKLVIVGDGPARPGLEKQVKRSGLVERVRFTGAIPHTELPKYYKIGDVFVTPSFAETFGFTVVEAMACGLPVLVINAPGIRDAVTPGVTGLLSANDPQEFGRCMLELAGESTQRKWMGEQAKFAAEKFSIDASIDAMVTIYHEVVQSHQPGNWQT